MERTIIDISSLGEFSELGEDVAFEEKKENPPNALNKNQTLKQELLLKLLKNKTKKVKVQLSKADRTKVLPLSWAQEQLWFISQLSPQASRAYHIPVIFRLKGNLNKSALDSAFATLLARHEILRTNIYINNEGEPYQHIHNVSSFRVEPYLLPEKSNIDEKLSAYKLLVNEIVAAPFDLAKDSLIRAGLIKCDELDHTLVLVLHHITTDAWSMGILTKELSTLYEAYCMGQDSPLTELAIQYVDYASWQKNWLQGEVLDKESTYWRERLQGVPLLEFPTDRPRPPIQSYKGAWSPVKIEAEVAKDLKVLGQRHGCTMFMSLLAVLNILLHRYTQQTDLCVGTPIANRLHSDIEPLIGFFVNTLALRIKIDSSSSFEDLLKQIKFVTLSAYEHQMMPFERVVTAVKPERSQAHSPLFQVMMVLHNVKGSELDIQGLSVEYEHVECSTSQFDFSLSLQELPDGSLSGGFEYATDLFNESTVARLGQHFVELVKVLSVKPECEIGQVEFLSDQEKYQLVIDWNDTAVVYPKDKCIHELFEAQVEANPNAVAAIFEGMHLTYHELNTQANRLAHYLTSERGIKPDTLIGICVERSLEMVIGILGILKSGGAYVPLDPDYPQARLAYMLADANLTTVISQSHLKDKVNIGELQALYLDDKDILQRLAKKPSTNLHSTILGLKSSNLAYVIYTSGSTGNPKGVMIEHHALVNRIDWMGRQYGCSPSDRILQKTPFSFDVSVWEFLWPLVSGAGIVLAKPDGHKDSIYLSELICTQKVTKLHFVPSMLGSMLSLGDLTQCKSLNQVFCSGEALPMSYVREFQSRYPFIELHNLYGPTEAAIDVSYWDCRQVNSSANSVPIGRPIQNIQLLILDQQLNIVPQGVAGELHIGGVGLARGYLNRPELTADKFISNSIFEVHSPGNINRLYKTGDLCRYLPDGNVEFLGRIDHQVKIRGFRIELGEIESTLMSFENVNGAVVIVKGTEIGDKQLVAFIASDNPIQTTVLKDYLGEHLPNYMIPNMFVILDSFPLTPNGKIDLSRLSAIELVRKPKGTVIEFSTPMQREIASIWAETLNLPLECVGIDISFFDMGGHSLLMMQVKMKVLKKLGINLTVNELYQNSTIESLSNFLDVYGRRDIDNNIKNKSNLYVNNFDATYLGGIAKKYGVAGIAVATCEDGKLSRFYAGVDDVETGSTLNENSGFRIYCLIKAIISFTVLILCDKNKLDLDKSIAEQIQTDDSSCNILNNLTLRHLLSHSSGIDDSNHGYIHRDSVSFADFFKSLKESGVLFAPGDSYLYSSSGLILCAHVIETVTGCSWIHAVNDHFFSLLDINLSGNLETGRQKSFAYSRNVENKLLNKIFHPGEAEYYKPAQASDIYLTSLDVVKIASVVLNDGKTLEGKRILSDHYVRQMRKMHVRIDNHFVMDGWSLGFMQFTRNVFGFLTGTHGHHTILAFDYAKGKAIAIQANTDNCMEFFQELVFAFLSENILETEFSSDRLELEKCEGIFESAGVNVEFFRKDEGFFVRARYMEANGAWSPVLNDTLLGFNACSVMSVGQKYPLQGVISFCEFDDNNVPGAVRIKQTLCKRKVHP